MMFWIMLYLIAHFGQFPVIFPPSK